jgi:hypothetical protein
VFSIEFDTKQLTRRLSAIERQQFPFALAGALNETAFQTRVAWGEQIKSVFDRPTRMTQTSVLYTKATKRDLGAATIFIKDDIGQGTPPGEYLKPQEFGGPRKQKPFERRLAKHPRTRKFYVPGRGADLNQFGNLPSSVLQKIASQLGTAEEFAGYSANETTKGRLRRLKRQRKKGGGGSYFVLPVRRGKLKPGVIYERIADAGDEGQLISHVRPVLIPVAQAPHYRPRFGAIALARRIAQAKFPAIFKQKLARAVLTAR